MAKTSKNTRTNETPSLLVRSIQVFLDGMQYAKGWYAVRRNNVISYADIYFYFKMIQFLSRNTTRDIQSQINLTIALGVIAACINLNIYFGRSKSRKFNKQTYQS